MGEIQGFLQSQRQQMKFLLSLLLGTVSQTGATEWPFNKQKKSMDGMFCSRVEADGVTFDYMNDTDTDGFPIYASNSNLYLAKHHDDMTNRDIGNSDYRVIHEGSESVMDINFDMNKSRCTRKDYDPSPATSIHVRWSLPYGSLRNANEWELGVSVKVLQSHDSTYFCTVGWGPGGYSGIQQTPDRYQARSGKLAIFSFWNYGRDGVNTVFVNKGEGVVETHFGGEGTGRKSWVNYPWSIGVKTAMKIKGKLIQRSTNLWQLDGYVRSLDNPKEWIHMATFTRASSQNPLNEYQFYSFIEDWKRWGGAQGYRYKRAAEFTDPYAIVDGQYVTLSRPYFTKTETGIDSFAKDLVVQKELPNRSTGSVYMSTGGSR